VKLIIQASAEDDMLRQYDWYERQGLSAIADRFSAAVYAGINAAIRTPKAGAPRVRRVNSAIQRSPDYVPGR
jgi:plasmid stabilization system protein ParE